MSQVSFIRQEIPAIFQERFASAKRLVHLIPDELASAVPNHPLFSFPMTNNLSDGFRDVSSTCFANAINRTAWYLRELLGEPKNFDTVAYMGSNDIRYFLFMFAAIKVGYKMLFLSPRNNLEGHLNVLRGVGCQIFLKAESVNIENILKYRHMHTAVVPELDVLLDESPVKAYPYHKNFEEACIDPCLVLHTTGSTGLPKPITWKVGILSTYEAWRTIPQVDGYVPTTVIYQQASRAYTSMPLFHTSGLNAGITWSLLLGVTLVYGAPHVVPNASYTDEMHIFAGVDASMGAPSIYEELSRDSESLQRINRLKYVVASGAPLSQSAGALISKHTRVICNLGATETACLQRLAPAVDDWAYFYWHPTHSGIEMRETIDGLFELFLVKDPSLRLYQGIFNTFPDIDEWSMNDLYARHPDPSKPYLYTYCGRKDDVIVLSNGEKLTPALMEATLMSSPLVKGAMVVGRGKFQPAVLIDLVDEPPKGVMSRHQMVERLLPTVAEANIHAPAHGKLDPYHILFADPQKPIAYLGQGKIQRSRTYAMYEHEIEQVYEAADEAGEHFGFSNLRSLDFSSKTAVLHWLMQLLDEIAGVQELDMRQDLFSAGVDSLQIMRLSRELRFQARKAGLGEAIRDRFFPSAIYKHPTLSSLAGFILKQAKEGFDDPIGTHEHVSAPVNTNDEVDPLAIEKTMQAMLHKYTDGLPRSMQSLPTPRTQNMTVILTGSTGSLGSYLLETLNQNKDVSQIICLNRSSDAAERQKQKNPRLGFGSLDPDRVKFFRADLSKQRLGLDPSVYHHLRMTATHIIHNQWPVNFNWPLSSFEPYLAGVRHLLDFCHSSSCNAYLLFISSVSAVSAWSSGDPAPEEPIHDLKVAGTMGYGQSKLLAECMLDKAARVSGIQSACCRVGIVAGPVENTLGLWNKHEYIPSIFISSSSLNSFPVTFPSRDRIDWLPVDTLSKILVEILVSSYKASPATNHGTEMYHVVNPNTISWSSIAPDILAMYTNNAMQGVPFAEWIEILGKSADEIIDSEKNPAIKLLDFYRNATKLQDKGSRMILSQKAENLSHTLRRLGPVNITWLKAWMQQWGLRSM